MIKFIKKRLSLTISLVLFVFIIMTISFLIVGLITIFIHWSGLWDFTRTPRHNPLMPIFFLIFVCMLLGTALTALLSKKTLNPIRKVIAATNKVAEGNFDVKVNIKGIGELEELSTSFNKMTQELSSIETLRSDFINNFSHEFKTPIVSIRGFAKLLKDGDLTSEERQEYLNIIISESERLSALSSNILTLSKYETLEIITDKSTFRLDEQIRHCILLLEPKWSKKSLNLNIDLDEILYTDAEDLTQQIWVNLIDNAIKFTYLKGEINIKLTSCNNEVIFRITDNGIGMDKGTLGKIYDKFYQGDTSHSVGGNGLGLAIVKRITSLCNGSIDAKSHLGSGSEFIIKLKN